MDVKHKVKLKNLFSKETNKRKLTAETSTPLALNGFENDERRSDQRNCRKGAIDM